MSDIAKMIAIAKKFGGGSSTPAPVVILPETELTVGDIEEGSGQYFFTTPFEHKPTLGGTYIFVWDGVEYMTSGIADASALMGVGTCYVLGNSDYMGLTDTLGSNPDASLPFCIMLIPDGMTEEGVTAYGMIISSPAATKPVLSIVQTGGASADSGSGTSDFIVTGMLNTTTFSVSNVSKTYDEVHAAAEERKNIKLYLDVQGQESYVVMPLTQMTPTVLAFGSIISEGARWRAQYTADGMTVKVG